MRARINDLVAAAWEIHRQLHQEDQRGDATGDAE
jgi:hypothetical protein